MSIPRWLRVLAYYMVQTWYVLRLALVAAIVVYGILFCVERAWSYEDAVYGYNVERLAQAIFHAEGGRHPYGILVKYKHTTPKQVCINTIRNQAKRHSKHRCGMGYLACLADRYAPIGAENDKPYQLNRYWLGNVVRLYEKGV